MMRLLKIEKIFVLFFTIFLVPVTASADLTSYIDEHNRFILNGVPFFPLGLYVAQQPSSGAGLSGELNEIANSSFDTLMNYSVNDGTDLQITQYLNQLEGLNLKLIFSLLRGTDFEGRPLMPCVNAAAEWPAPSGSYYVYARWSQDTGDFYSHSSTYMASYNNGASSFEQIVNQHENGGQWNQLGAGPYNFTMGDSVMLFCEGADGILIADAIGWDSDGIFVADPEFVVDNSGASFAPCTWPISDFAPGYYGTDYQYYLFPTATIEQKTTAFKDHPAVIGWYISDEVAPDRLCELEAAYHRVKELDQDHPVWSVHWNADWLLQEAHTTDIVGMDSYPIDNLPITVVGDVADVAMQAGKPLWLVPQIFSWTDYPGDPAGRNLTGRPPTREEMRAMTYLATNHGAKGLIYYSYFNIRDDADYGTRWPQIKEIAGEIDQLRPVFLSIDETSDNDITCDNPDIDIKLMREGDLSIEGGNTYYLFAVNTKEEAVSGVSFQIKLAKKPLVVDTLFEGNRQVPVSDAHFTDDFDLYEVHVYDWAGDFDQDGDGFDNSEEWGPSGNDPNYDGNGDEPPVPDSQQDNVASGRTYDRQNYVTLAVADPATLSDCQVGGNPHPGDSPVDTNFPYGFFAFEVHGLAAPGDCTEVTLFLPKNTDIVTYYKYGPTPSNPTDHWYEFVYDQQTGTGAEIFQEANRTRIVLHLCDGLRGDDDLVADGKIVDVGGSASKTAAAVSGDNGANDNAGITPPATGGGGGGGGGCFITTSAR